MLNNEQLKNTYLGFTDSYKAMQKARIENTLEKYYRYNDVVMTAKEFIILRLQEGAKPHIYEDVVEWSRKLRDYKKPKTEYALRNESGSYGVISKTEYDFACYIIENNFIDDIKALEFIQKEQEQKEQIEADRIKAKQQAKEKAEREKQEKEQFENWLNEQTKAYNNQDKLSLLKEIFLAETGQFGGGSIRLLVLIENFDNPQCKEKIKEWLSYYNTASLKTFFHLTGINLGKTNKEIQSRLNDITSKDFTGMIQFKARKKVEETEQEVFYIYEWSNESEEYCFQEVMAEPFNKYKLDLFIRKHNNYAISEAKTGLLLASGKTKAEALNSLKENIDRIGIEELNVRINNFIKEKGISPKYNNQEVA